MSVTPPLPRRKVPTEAEIEAVVNRGGAIAEWDISTPADDEKPAHINARLTKGIVRQIDTLRAKRGRKPGSPKLLVSQQDWVLEACLEKIERDSKSNTPT